MGLPFNGGASAEWHVLFNDHTILVVGTHLVLGKRKNKNKIIRESANIVMQLIRASNLANGPIRHRISGRTTYEGF